MDMEPTTLRDQIREIAVKANPDILSDKYTCICGHGVVCHSQTHVLNENEYIAANTQKPCLHCLCKFYHARPGRPVRLADMLIAIEVSAHAFKDEAKQSVTAAWDLRKDDLDALPDKAIAEIATITAVENDASEVEVKS